jgi:hypothetical protein
MLQAEQVDYQLPTGPDPEPYLRAIEEYAEAGYTHVYLHQIAQDQEGFFTFWAEELAPKVGESGSAKANGSARVA